MVPSSQEGLMPGFLDLPEDAACRSAIASPSAMTGCAYFTGSLFLQLGHRGSCRRMQLVLIGGGSGRQTDDESCDQHDDGKRDMAVRRPARAASPSRA
jgi:hypothetical protein